jgi:hypothetical protein
MPLLDHFHPPLRNHWPWDGVYSYWTSAMVRQLNRKWLPQDYVAFPHVYRGGRLELDGPGGQEEGTAALWIPSPPTLDLPVDCVDMESFEVQVFNREGWPRLAAVVALASPANEDGGAHRDAFAFKCAGYLQAGVSLLLVDVVTGSAWNFHRHLLDLLRLPGQPNSRGFPDLYATAYRVFTANREGRLEVWEEALTVGASLPTLPLWISSEAAVPLDLEASHRETCEALRIPS